MGHDCNQATARLRSYYRSGGHGNRISTVVMDLQKYVH